MTLPSEAQIHKLQFYVTTPYACGYLPKLRAQSLIATPQHLINADVYSGLIQQGFRRSGKFAYRPHCENCNACTAVRLIVDLFAPSRSQKRSFKLHSDLVATVLPLDFYPAHFELYSRYQTARHSEDIDSEITDSSDKNSGVKDSDVKDSDVNDSDIKDSSKETQYREFLVESNVETRLIEFRLGDQLKMVSVVDVLRDGISAVYTFYETRDLHSSYGTFNVMWLNEWTRSLGLPYLYLGYWIKNSPKMVYKQNFKPQQALIDGEWLAFTKF